MLCFVVFLRSPLRAFRIASSRTPVTPGWFATWLLIAEMVLRASPIESAPADQVDDLEGRDIDLEALGTTALHYLEGVNFHPTSLLIVFINNIIFSFK